MIADHRSPGRADPPGPALVALTVVTGGSEGLGLAIAERFAAAGHRLLLIARGQGALEATAEGLRKRYGGPVATLALDITAPDAAETVEAAAAAAGGYVDVLVNNAGIGLSGAFHGHDARAIEDLLQLNVGAMTRLMRHVLPGMLQRRQGGVLNVASLGGYVPGPHQAVYYASKAYVISLSEAVAAEVAPHGVRISVVAPGPVATRFHAKMNAESSLYRRLLPAPRADYVAWWAVTGYKLGARVIIPGFLNCVMIAGLRILPHRLVIPVVGWLLKPRGREAGNA